MPALICGSLAFDTIMTFPGRFAQQILPDQVHILNVSFVVPTMRREFGGCAGNIAYTHALLGGEPIVLAAAGPDGQNYLERIRSWGATTDHIDVIADSFTAQCFIMTDLDNNQITAFHPGAMQHAHLNTVPANKDLKIGIVAPDGREAMVAHAQQMQRLNVPFIFDPGQQLPQFGGDGLRAFLQQSTWVAVNDYEGRMLCERTGETLESLSRSHLKGIVVTLGADGSEIWRDGQRVHVPGIKAEAIADPTGCGDAFRAALLYGLERDWPLERCVQLGNRIGAIKIACRGPQNHKLPPGLANSV